MPSRSHPIIIDGKVVGIACSREKRKPCSSCGRNASIQCDHPVTRKGKEGTCDRWLCQRCANRVGPNRDFCPAHFRASGAK